jgi:S1-C subfamily serine protease
VRYSQKGLLLQRLEGKLSAYAVNIHPKKLQGLTTYSGSSSVWVFALALVLSIVISANSPAASLSPPGQWVSTGPNSVANTFAEPQGICCGFTNLAQLDTKKSTLKIETPAKPSAKMLQGASVGTGWPTLGGYVVTSNHVVAGCSDVVVINKLGEELPAQVVVGDGIRDIAILEVSDARKLPPALPLAKKKARLGTTVFTIGFPRVHFMGRSPKLFTGVISSVNGLYDDPTSYHTTVPIQPGNSGGPLLNMKGEVVGLVTSMLGLRDKEDGDIQILQNASCVLKIGSLEKLLPLLPERTPALEVLPRSSASLENLAERIEGSILLVVAK